MNINAVQQGSEKTPPEHDLSEKDCDLAVIGGIAAFLGVFCRPYCFWGCAEKLLSFRQLDFLFIIHNFVDIFICYDIIK